MSTGTVAASDAFRAAHPVDLLLSTGEGEPVLHILDDDAPGEELHVCLENRSDTGFTLQAPALLLPRPSNFHVELRFRPGVLDEDRLGDVALMPTVRASSDTGTWHLAHERNDDRTVSFFLLREQPTLVSPGERLHLTLRQVRAGAGGGSRTTIVEAVVRTAPAQARRNTAADLHRHDRVRIVTRRGAAVLPLAAAWYGTDTVLNDGTSSNELLLELVNTGTYRIEFDGTGLDTATALTVADAADHDRDPQRLADAADLAAMEVEALTPGWAVRVDDEGARPVWLLRPVHDTGLDPGQALEVRLANIVTAAASGTAELAIDYVNVPGHWDGRRTATVHKAPLLFRDRPGTRAGVGIHTAHPRLDLAIGAPDTGLGGRAGWLALHTGGVERLRIDSHGTVDVPGRLTAGELDVAGPFGARGPIVVHGSTAAVDLSVGEEGTGLKGRPDGRLALAAGGRDRFTVGPDGPLVAGDGEGGPVLEVSGRERHLTLTNPRSASWVVHVEDSTGYLYLQHVTEGFLGLVGLQLEPGGDVAVGGRLKLGAWVLTERHLEKLDDLLKPRGLIVQAEGTVRMSLPGGAAFNLSFTEPLVLRVPE